MLSVTIGSATYDSYQDLATADTYLAASIWATDWNKSTTTTDLKGQALVTATRWLDELTWATLYNTQALRLAVPAIVQACTELAALLVADPALRDSMREAALRSIKADTVQLDYFRPPDVTVESVMPRQIMVLIAPYLDSATEIAGSLSFGVTDPTVFSDTYARRTK